MDVTIAIATFGDRSWVELAEQRALPSARQSGAPVVQIHLDEGGIHDARNACLNLVDTKYLIYLDADDELEPGYLDAMATGTADVRAPSVAYVTNGRRQRPEMPRVVGHTHQCAAGCLTAGNWLVVGSMVRTQLLRGIGGWRDFPWSEDWDVWLRCHLAGASIEPIPRAVYRAHVRPDSRNRGASQAERLATHRAIVEANGLHARRM